jgi:hypothetical protein
MTELKRGASVPCNCKDDIEAKMTERFTKNSPEASGHEVVLDGYGLVLSGNSFVMRGCTPMKLTAIYTLKKGGTKVKTTNQSMFFNYCPFCGTKYGDGLATKPTTTEQQ